MSARPIYWHPVEFHGNGMTFKGSASHTFNRDGSVDLHTVRLTHINDQPIAYGCATEIDCADMTGDEFDRILAQIPARDYGPPDEDCITESRRLALSAWVHA